MQYNIICTHMQVYPHYIIYWSYFTGPSYPAELTGGFTGQKSHAGAPTVSWSWPPAFWISSLTSSLKNWTNCPRKLPE